MKRQSAHELVNPMSPKTIEKTQTKKEKQKKKNKMMQLFGIKGSIIEKSLY